MMVHFPIAFVVATFGVDFFYWWSGDPFWARVGLWSAGFTFWTGVAASIVGTGELLLVPGIRLREASWSHAVAAMTLVAITGANWGLRLYYPKVDPAARSCTLWSRRGDGWLRRLARWQARVRSWDRYSGFAQELTKPSGREQVCGELVEWMRGLASTTQMTAVVSTR